MKTTIIFLAACFLAAAFAPAASSQTATDDVIYLKNGGIVRGAILEMTPEGSVKIQTRDGNVYVYAMSGVERIAKEPSLAEETWDELDRLESWYLCFALGYAHASYPSPMQQSLDFIASQGSHIGISMDLPAVYWPVGRRTAIGGALNLVGDRYEVNSSRLQISEVTLGFSVMHFILRDVGDGPFLRGDVGIASLSIEDSFGSTATSDAGSGFLLGGGYAIPVSSETRILINMNFASRRVEGDDFGALSITVGVML